MALRDFVKESNLIEGICRPPLVREMRAHEVILAAPQLTLDGLEWFVRQVAPGHSLRRSPLSNVRVGNHIAPRGGPEIVERISQIIGQANTLVEPWHLHRAYEVLHPFTDGNGRSGRALWLWMMLRAGIDPYALRRGFLHTWYYQSLAAASEVPRAGVLDAERTKIGPEIQHKDVGL